MSLDKSPEGWHPVATAACVIACLALAIGLRLDGFGLPHPSGDESLYVGLAVKVDAAGLKNYNIRGLDVISSTSGLTVTRMTEGEGNLLGGLKKLGLSYFDVPLHHIPYAFPAALVLSHSFFAPDEPYSRVGNWAQRPPSRRKNPRATPRYFRPAPRVAEKQFYALIGPLCFSLVLVFATFLLALALFRDVPIALVAMFLMTVSPIDIFTAQKIWADDMTAACSTLGVALYVISRDRNILWMSLGAGLLCGLSAITKQNGAFVVIALGLWHLFAFHGGSWDLKSLSKWIFDRHLMLFGVGIAAVAFHWFWIVFAEYGTPFFRPDPGAVVEVAKTPWYRIVTERPWYVYLIGIPYQNPVFAFALMTPVWLWLRRGAEHWRQILLLSIWIAVYFFVLNVYLWDGGKEHRYFLPAYPAFAVASAFLATRLSSIIDTRYGHRLGTAGFVCLLVASALWSVPIAARNVASLSALIMVPF